MLKFFILLISGLFFLQGQLISQESEVDEYSEMKGEGQYIGSARHIEARGVGHKRGYTTLEGLFFPVQAKNEWFLIDVRGHRFTNNEYAANLGFGGRYFSEKQERVYGINTFYDYRSDCSHSESFHQIGLGLEMFNYDFDVRINGYFPIHRKRLIQHCFFDDYDGDFYMVRNKYKSALMGFNIEIGAPLCRSPNNTFYVALGPYYFNRDCRDVYGGKFRFELRLYGYVTSELVLSYDNRFDARVQGQISLTYPKRECKNGMMKRPIHRFEIIVLDKFCKWDQNF